MGSRAASGCGCLQIEGLPTHLLWSQATSIISSSLISLKMCDPKPMAVGIDIPLWDSKEALFQSIGFEIQHFRWCMLIGMVWAKYFLPD